MRKTIRSCWRLLLLLLLLINSNGLLSGSKLGCSQLFHMELLTILDQLLPLEFKLKQEKKIIVYKKNLQDNLKQDSRFPSHDP